MYHAHDDPNKTISVERPYQPSGGHKEGKDLRYGGTGKYDGAESGTASKEEGPEAGSAKGRN